jgi:hypothetical protein
VDERLGREILQSERTRMLILAGLSGSLVVTFTTRFVQAASEIEAESAAVELIRQDPKLGRSVLNERADPPTIHVEDVDEVAVDDVPQVTPGFAFYPASQDSDP